MCIVNKREMLGSHSVPLSFPSRITPTRPYPPPGPMAFPSRPYSAQFNAQARRLGNDAFSFEDLVGQDDPAIRREESTLCPFGTPVLGDVCTVGCMACDDGVRCCSPGDTCEVTAQCLQDPFTKQCPFASYLPACMMCNNERGEPTLKACTPGSNETCPATNFCTTYAVSPRPRPSQLAGSPSANGHYDAQRVQQEQRFLQMQAMRK